MGITETLWEEDLFQIILTVTVVKEDFLLIELDDQIGFLAQLAYSLSSLEFADVGVAKKVATLVPSPETPVEIGKPVHEVSVPLEGVPSIGVTSVGLVAKTASPLPVSSVRHEARFAELGVARNAATLVPSPLTPDDIGSPVQLVSVPLEGVPRTGVTSVGDVSESVSPLCSSCTVVVFTTNGYLAAMFSPR